jgi:hypothetical protein
MSTHLHLINDQWQRRKPRVRGLMQKNLLRTVVRANDFDVSDSPMIERWLSLMTQMQIYPKALKLSNM